MSDPRPKPPTTPPDQPQPKKPIGDPPSKEQPRTVQAGIAQPQQFTLEPGDNGRGDGPTHSEPLVRNSKPQEHYGRGTYGNDQFAAEHHDDFVHDLELPEGLQDPQKPVSRPTHKPKEARYGRIGDHGKG